MEGPTQAPSDAPESPLPSSSPGPRRGKPRRSTWRELPILLVVAFAVAILIKTFLLQAFFIQGFSMHPTLEHGDRVLIEKLSYRFGEPDRGDVVVIERRVSGAPQGADEPLWTRITDSFRELFGFPTAGETDFIKRVVAVEGDTVRARRGRIVVNGNAVDERYLPTRARTLEFGPVQVPEGMIFVLGDNRANSEDSRRFGAVPVDTVVGRAFVVIWPASRAEGL